MSAALSEREPPALEAEEAGRLAEQVLVHLLGSPPGAMRPLGGGLTNFVFEADHPDGTLVLRMSATPSKARRSIASPLGCKVALTRMPSETLAL